MSGWHERSAGARLTVWRGPSRLAPVLASDGWTAPAPRDAARFRAALAHQVRQDLWRALRDLRGFAPEISVASAEGRVEIAAGGRLLSGAPAGAAERVRAAAAGLLASRPHRRRWTGHALRRAGGRA